MSYPKIWIEMILCVVRIFMKQTLLCLNVKQPKAQSKFNFNLGFGGLGQMGAIMAKAMGNEVTIISTSNKKEELARQMGMDGYIVSKDLDSMKKSSNSLDMILDTSGADHEIEHYIDMLKKNGTFVVLGIVSKPFEVNFLIANIVLSTTCL